MKKTCFFMLLVLAFTATAMASMVIAPSQIVVNSVSNEEGNFFKNKTIDDTIKTIISYPLDSDEIVNLDEGSFEISMTIYSNNNPNDNENEDDSPIVIYAEAIRYCYIDSNLIVEFDRSYIVQALGIEEFSDWLEVVVAGKFSSGNSEFNNVINEVSEIFVYNRSNNNE